jgi:hypothetical protein
VEIVGVGFHFVAVPGLRGAAVAAAVMSNDTIAMLAEEEHLRIPIVGRERPAVREDDRLPAAPVLIENLRAVVHGDVAHGENRLETDRCQE